MSVETPITIRRAAAQDLEALHTLLRALAESMGQTAKMTADRDDLLRFGFSAESAFTALLAERAGEAIGMCIYFRTFSTWRGEPGVYVQDLYVSERVRGKGLGRRLLAAVADRAKKEYDATHIRLAVDVRNVSAQEFYSALGLRQRDDEMIFQIDGAAYDALGEDSQ